MDTPYKQTNEQLVKIKADHISKALLGALFILSFFIILALFVVLYWFVPSNVITLRAVDVCPLHFNDFHRFCHKFSTRYGKTWESYVSGLEMKNQFFYITGEPIRVNHAMDDDVSFEIDYKAVIIPVDEEEKQIDNYTDFEHTKEHKVMAHCKKGNKYCEPIGLVMYPQIKHNRYRIVINFTIQSDLEPSIEGFYFNAKAQSIRYTDFVLSVRYAFLIFSLISGAIYTIFYCAKSASARTFEHKYILALSVSAVLFNDPLYAMTIFEANKFLAVLSALFVVQFISILLFFWLIMFQRMYLEKIKPQTKLINIRNIIILIIFFVCLMISTSTESLVYRFDPSFHIEYDLPVLYKVVFYVTLVLAITILVYFGFTAFKIYKAWNKIIPRHKFFFLFSIYFMIVLLFYSVAGLYQSYDSHGARLIVLFGIFNYYVFVLQFFWRTTSSKHVLGGNSDNLDQSSNANINPNGNFYFNDEIDVEISKTNNLRNFNNSELTDKVKDEVQGNQNDFGSEHSSFEIEEPPVLRKESDMDSEDLLENMEYRQFNDLGDGEENKDSFFQFGEDKKKDS